MLKLYSSWMGSSAHRARIALALKGLDYELVPVRLALQGGEQDAAAYRRINPQGMVPVLVDGDRVLTQSMAIMEYLDEAYPRTPPLLPQGLVDCVLVPQVCKAHAAGLDMGRYPVIERIYRHCQALTPFIEASPERQPDAPAAERP